MKKLTIIFFFFFVISKNNGWVHAQNLPDFKCIDRINVPKNDVLTWFRDFNTCYPFIVFMSTNQNGPYLPVDTIDIPDTLRTSDSISNPNADIRWYYLACLSNPALTTDTLDNQEPAPPVIKYVSVNGNAVDIFWTPSTSPETFSYLIYCSSNGKQEPVQGRNTAYFLFTQASPNSQAESFGMDARDSCNTKGLPSSQHTTVFLKTTIDSCAQTASLNWTPYKGWSGVINYEVFESINGTVPVSVSSPLTNTSFVVPINNDKDSVCYTIHATSQDGYISLSNSFCKKIDIAKSPGFLEVENVTVIDNNNIQIEWLIDSTSEINSMEVLRSNDGSTYSPITTLNPPFNLNSLFIYNDKSVNADFTNYFYKVSGTNCKGAKLSDNFGKNILLTGLPENSFINTIKWNEYQLWDSPVSSYLIFRRTDAGSAQITSVGAGTTSYQDNIADVESSDGFFYYTVVAVESGDTTKSFSNEAIVRQPSKIFIPNAFVPDGNISENKIFKPTILFPVGNSYSFLVFDRWGKKIFQSENISDGWDGSIDGKPASQGAYAFLIKLTSPTGNKIEEKGTVMLIR